MSSISGVSAASYTSTQATVAQRSAASGATQGERPERVGLQQGPEQRLEQALTEAGVDAETTEAIKTELKAAFEEGLSEGGGPPSEELQAEVESIFESYGLEASDFLGRPGGPGAGGPPPGGPPPAAGGESETEETSSENSELLSLIEQLSEEESDPTKLAELIVDAIYGVDETV